MSKQLSAKRVFTKKQSDPIEDALAIDALVLARVKLLFQAPFFGNIATRLRLKNADTWLPTAATDGKHFYYNAEFINSPKPNEVVFLVAHELFHAILDHCGTFTRIEERYAQMWNIAADYVVNGMAVKYRLGDMITTVPCLYDKKYEGWAVEEVYDDLMKDAKIQKISMEDLMDKMLDHHLDGESNGEEGDDGPSKLSDAERQQIRDELKEAMLASAQAVGIGNVPGEMKRFIDGLIEPKMDWRQYLNADLESQVKNDFTYMKPGRRSFSCEAILPSMMKMPAVDVTLALDMSGSIGAEEIRDFFSEVHGMVQQYDSFRINVMTWDTQVYNYQSFTEDNADELFEYEPMGGGGTDANCIFEYITENEIPTKQVVVFTDGMFHEPQEPQEGYSVLWIVKNNHDIELPFGTTVKYD